MPTEAYIIELTLVAMPLPKEKEEAYWDAIYLLVEMMGDLTPPPLPKWEGELEKESEGTAPVAR